MAVEKRVQIKEADEPGADIDEHNARGDDDGVDKGDNNGEGLPTKGEVTQQLADQTDSKMTEDSSAPPHSVQNEKGATGEIVEESLQERTKSENKSEHVADVSKNKDTTRTVSSIDVKIPQVEKDENNTDENEGGDNKDNNDQDADDDDDQSVVMGTTKSVTFSIHHNLDDVDEEIARVTLNKAVDDQMANFDVQVDYEGRAQTTNTPVTVVTEYQEDGRKSTENRRGDIFDHAMTVMRNRSSLTHYTQSQTTIKSHLGSATSSRATIVGEAANGLPIYSLPSVIAKIQKPPFAKIDNCSFYVLQKRVHPVPPIKAWKGYDANVYFEPMVCKKAVLSSFNDQSKSYPQNMTQQQSPPKAPTISSEDTGGIELPEINQSNLKTAGTTKSTSVKSVRIAQSAASVRTGVKSRAPTAIKSRASTSASRPLAVLDKLSVFKNIDSNIREDIRWIDGLESTGTLQVGEPLRRTGSTTHVYTRATGHRHYKMRICRGLVSHQLAGQNTPPALGGVSGGRLVDSPSKSEYLEREYQGESHFLNNAHGMFTSPVPNGSSLSPSPLPALYRKQTSPFPSAYNRASYPPAGKSNSKRQSVESGK